MSGDDAEDGRARATDGGRGPPGGEDGPPGDDDGPPGPPGEDDDRAAGAPVPGSSDAPAIRRRALLAAAGGAIGGIVLLEGVRYLDVGIPSLGLLGGGGGCSGGPELPDCLGTVAPSKTDAGGSCRGIDGSSYPATGGNAANWFGFGDCGTWKRYDVDPDGEYEFVVYTGACTPLSSVAFDVEERDGGEWATERQVSPGSDAGTEYRAAYSPDGDRIRINAGEDGPGTYVSVYERPRWSDGTATSVDATTVQAAETTEGLPEGAELVDGASPEDVVWNYEGAAAQGVTWNGKRVGTDRITYRIGIAGGLLTRRTDQGGTIRGGPDGVSGSGSGGPVSVPTHSVVQNGYTVTTGEGARVETASDAFTVDGSDWRYGAEGSGVAEDRKAALADSVGRAFDPAVTAASAAGDAVVSAADWVTEDLFTEAAGEALAERSDYLFALRDVWTDVENTCDDWLDDRVTANAVRRVTSVCTGTGAAGHVAEVHVSVPRGESASITLSSEFLAGPPFEDGRVSMERELVLNPDAESTARTTPASRGTIETVTARQDGDSFTVRPLQDGSTVEEMYEYSTDGHPHSHSGYGLTNTSTLFLWRGPEGVSLVMIHDERNDATQGGSVEIELEGLPEEGEWAVKDDPDHNADSFSTDRMVGQWTRANTDGGAYRGIGCGESQEITITPNFEEGIDTWRLLSADATGTLGRIYSLDPESSVTIDLSDGAGSDSLF